MKAIKVVDGALVLVDGALFYIKRGSKEWYMPLYQVERKLKEVLKHGRV